MLLEKVAKILGDILFGGIIFGWSLRFRITATWLVMIRLRMHGAFICHGLCFFRLLKDSLFMDLDFIRVKETTYNHYIGGRFTAKNIELVLKF
jgi:hypothetical protein